MAKSAKTTTPPVTTIDPAAFPADLDNLKTDFNGEITK
jgi:hypothetical protein